MIKYDLVAFIAARKKVCLSQADIAKLAKVTEKTIANFENGQRPRSAWGHRVIKAYQSLGWDWEVAEPKEKKGPKPKRKYVRKAKAAAAAEDEDDGDPEDSPVMKPPNSRPIFDAERLKAVVRAFVADKDLSIHESGRSGARHIMVPPDDFYEFGQIILRNAGIRVG
jgi:transcriptional regulator with XRE-family HTH domain